MRQLTFLFIVGILICISSCRTDFDTEASTGDLTFSSDTLYLGTVFKDISSSTYELKVYNNSNNDISIPTIQFAKGLDSKYRMTVDGMQGTDGKVFDDVTLLAKDSLYIFIEVTADITDANATDFLYTDQISFDSGENLQQVELVTLIQDATFLYPQKNSDGTSETISIEGESTSGFYLDDNDDINGNELIFTNEKPYVIYGYAAVPSGKTAVFEPGARVYFHDNSGLMVDANASINVNGTASTTEELENEVIFQGDRLESDYDDVDGQWETVFLDDGSTNNTIDHLTIKNATIGLLIKNNDDTTVEIKNTQIYNCTNYGILAKSAKINGENIVINNAGNASLACTYGGEYSFTHCTFNNNWSSSNQAAVLINNYSTGSTPEVKDLTGATFNNCIIYGSYSNELSLEEQTGADFVYQFNYCLIKYATTTNSYYLFDTDTTHYNSIIRNEDPKFYSVSDNELNIESSSSAVAKGSTDYLVPLDINGDTRTTPPDLGAYQNKDLAE
jgi:hypothetical protein